MIVINPGAQVEALEAELRATQSKLEECEARLRESEAHFHSVFEGMGEGLLMTDLEDRVQYANARMSEMCGYTRDEMIGRPAYELFLPREQWPNLSGHNERRAQGFSEIYEAELLRKNGARFWGLIHATPLRDASGQVVGTIGAQIDITQRKRAEDALRESEERFRQLLEQAADSVMVHDQSGQMLMANARVCQSLGYTREEMLALSVPDFEMNFDAESVRQRWAELKSGEIMTVDGAHRRKDGSDFPVEVRVGLVQWSGQQVMLAIARDVTDRKQIEADMNASLREKEVMLQEIHHRVKNNLQIICSLLNLQTEAIETPQLRAALSESRNRVRSMALIHEKLYQSPDLAHIDLGDYLESLAASLVRSATDASGRVRLRVEAVAVPLDIDRAVPCGLIVNELVTNAFKYAFPGARAGTIMVELRARGDDLTLIVRDDGVGMNADLDWENSDSIGLGLVAALTQQLEGEVEMSACEDANKGTRWTIRFKKEGD